MTLVFSLLRCYTELNALRKGGYTCNGLERLRFLQKRKPLSFSGSKCTLLYLSAESGACSMRPAALLWGAFVLHRRFPFVKASPLGRGVTEGDGEGKAADGEAPIQRYSYSDKETTYRCTRTLPCRACPLSLLRSQLSQRESLLAEGRQQTAYKGYTFLSIIIERVFPHEP